MAFEIEDPDGNESDPLSPTLEDFMEKPAELIEEIVSRLPVKDVTRCKAVCRGMLGIVSKNQFKLNHRDKMKNRNRIGYLFEKGNLFNPPMYVAVDSLIQPYYRRCEQTRDRTNQVVSSCYGLVCVCNRRDELILWNPSTRGISSLPRHPNSLPYEKGIFKAVFGMGYVESTDDYLLFKISVNTMNNFRWPRVWVYSRNLRIWCRGPDFPYKIKTYRPGVYAGGNLNWLVELEDGLPTIGMLNVENMQYSRVGLNGVVYNPGRYYHLDSLDDKTLVIYTTYSRPGEANWIWILQDYKDHTSWIGVSITLNQEATTPNHLMCIQPMSYLQPDRNRFTFRIDPTGAYGIYCLTTRSYSLLDDVSVRQQGSFLLTKYTESFENPIKSLSY